MIPPHSHRLKRSLFPEGEGTTENDIPLFQIPLSQWVRRYAQFRALLRIGALTIWVPLSVGFEACLLPIPGIAKICWTRVVWGVLCRIIGLRIRVIGNRVGTIGGYRARQRGERPVIYVSNHTSWLDVPVLGTVLPSVFVAKGEIEHWPIMGLVSKIGRTIFVSRQRSTTGHERNVMIQRIAHGDNLVLFPEGTSSDGSRVLPFMSAFFSIAKLSIPKTKLSSSSTSLPEITPLIQPVSIVYDRLDGLPISRLQRPVFSWYGNMDLGPHIWQLLKRREGQATVILHSPLDPDLFPSRKALAQATWDSVVKGAAELRQNHTPHIQPGRFHSATLPTAFLPAYARIFDSLLEKIFSFLFISSCNTHDD